MFKKQLVVAIACALCVTTSQQAYSANDIEVVSGLVQTNITGDPSFTTTDDSAQLGVDDLVSRFDVSLTTGVLGTNNQDGDVTFSGDMNDVWNLYSVTVNAHNNINLNSTFAKTGFGLDIVLNPDSDGLNGGAVYLNGTMGGLLRTTINGALTIDGFGAYNLDYNADLAGLDANVAFASLTADSITVNPGGALNFTAGRLNLTGSGMNVGSSGLLGDAVSLGSDMHLILSNNNVLTIDAGATFALDGGMLEVGDINTNVGFSFNSGQLNFTNRGLTVGSGGFFGDTLSLASGRHLTLSNNNVLTVDATGTFSLDGGHLEVGNIANTGSFGFNSGHLNLTNAGLTIGTGQLLGNDFVLGSGKDLTLSNGNVLTINSGASVSLDGGNLRVGNIVKNGTFNFTAGTLGLSSDLIIGAGGFLGDNVSLRGGIESDATRHNLDVSNNTVTVEDGASLEMTGSSTLDGGFETYGGYFGALTNRGTVTDGGSLAVVNTLTNDGANAIFTLNGRLSVGSIVNTNGGRFVFNSGQLVLRNDLSIGGSSALGNDFTLDANKELILIASGSALNIDNGASFTMDGGVLQVDTINNNGDFIFNSGVVRIFDSLDVSNTGLLGNDVSLGNNALLVVNTVTIDANSSLVINGGALNASSIVDNGSFNFSSGRLSLYDNLSVGNTGLLGNSVALSTNRTLNIFNSTVNVEAGANLSVSSGEMNFSNVTNSGHVNISGGKIVAGSYTQDAGRTTVNGILSASSVTINGGSLYGDGQIAGNLTMAGGILRPGNSPGSLEVTGDFVLTPAGTLHMEVASDGGLGYLWDQLIVGGNYDIQGGLIQFSLLDGFGIADLEADFTLGDFFRTGTTGSDLALTDPEQLALFSNADIFAYDVGLDSWYSLAFDGAGVFTGTPSVAPVPVPAAVWLFGSGLLGLIGVARRRAA